VKILYFNYLWDIYGASLGSAIKPIELFAEMRGLGHEVEMIWFKDQPGGPAPGTFKASARNFLKRHLAFLAHDPKLFLENLIFARREAEAVEKFKPDIIIARLDLYLFSAVRTARKYHLPVLIEADSPPVYEAVHFQPQYWRIPFIPRLIEGWVLRNADFNVMQSMELQHYFVHRHRLRQERTDVVSNGADIHKFVPDLKDAALLARLGWQEGPILGFIGSMSVWHGIENLLRIIDTVLSHYPAAKFLLVGSGGGHEASIRRFIQQRRLTRQVILTGYVPHAQIPAYIQLMDVVLAPYPNLPFFYYSPVKVFEYMAAGKAVVTTRIGQLKCIIRDGWDGILCPPGDFNAFIAAISGLLEDTDMAKQMGLNARQTISTKHTWRHKASAYEAICARLIEEYQQKNGHAHTSDT